MDRLIPSERQIKLTGKKGTVLFADPCSIWHRGLMSKKTDRNSLWYFFNNGRPHTPEMGAPNFPLQGLPRMLEGLTPKQKSVMKYPYLLNYLF
jgi:hypothetical protein